MLCTSRVNDGWKRVQNVLHKFNIQIFCLHYFIFYIYRVRINTKTTKIKKYCYSEIWRKLQLFLKLCCLFWCACIYCWTKFTFFRKTSYTSTKIDIFLYLTFSYCFFKCTGLWRRTFITMKNKIVIYIVPT